MTRAARLRRVPVIDIGGFRTGAAKAEVAAQVAEACRGIGFLVISGHGVSEELVDRIDRIARAFFDLPLDEKMAVVRPSRDVTRGYVPLEDEAVAASRGVATEGDLNESFMIGPVDANTDDPYCRCAAAGTHFHPNLWPARPPGLREAFIDYYREMSALAARLMRIFALALNVPETWFDSRIDRHVSRLRVRNYPPCSPRPGQLRAGPHSDYGSLTILKTEAVPGGLQVMSEAGEWTDVPALPGTFVVNLGDMMARWTNDRWVSTLHRVANPPSGETNRRQSIVFFHNPNYDAVIDCVPSCGASAYPPIAAGAYLNGKFIRTQGPGVSEATAR